MHIVVCMKQVPRDNSVKINSDLSINADGIEKIINLFDEYAIEEGLAWNEKHGGKLTVLSMGSDEWVEQMRRALAMGATDSLLLKDASFANLDTLAAAKVVATAIKKLGDVDLVFCGRNSTDDESGAFAPALARALGWAQLTYVGKVLEVDPAGKKVTAERHLETVIETVTASLPAVVSVIKDINNPRYPSLLKIKKVAKIQPPVWTAADLGVSGLSAAATISSRVPPPPRPSGEIIDGPDAAAKVRKLVDKLLENQII
ncbi:electron transfer flavoprotein subunit beta/FixA family protein [Candidatus Chloroploca sp. M-50]|uniref:Electron transfer flavoprotein small subunit n=1 Tax=Candidatus Chloroploca mongolica TaxID=2528176 RepID=A0ABS4D6M0_9CHLR|nr:electron transfer flavoprotein subunit beta/FixA family protein [Candidatus Chloroploca mongolica]MBP1465092.1 electron transfer flavoprotein subunit beta/FixA family protein [Candidatus Chloroploca mongolica]